MKEIEDDKLISRWGPIRARGPVRIHTVCIATPIGTTRHKSVTFGPGWTATKRRALVPSRLNTSGTHTYRSPRSDGGIATGNRTDGPFRGKFREETIRQSDS